MVAQLTTTLFSAGMKAQYLVGPTGQIQDLPPALR